MRSSVLPPPVTYDSPLITIADYVLQPPAFGYEAHRNATLALLDALAGAIRALQDPACTRLLGPLVPGTTQPLGARVPGTNFELDPATAAFGISCCASWSDHPMIQPAALRHQPSDHLGALLAATDWLGRSAEHAHPLQAFSGMPLPAAVPPTLHDLLTALIQAQEINRALAQENIHAGHPLDPVLLQRVAATAVTTRLLGGQRPQVLAAVSRAWQAGVPLGPQEPDTPPARLAPRASGEAAAQAIVLALRALDDDPGWPQVLSAPDGGFQAVFWAGQPLTLAAPLDSRAMEKLLFNLVYPAAPGVHTALEAAIKLHPQVAVRTKEVARIEVTTYDEPCPSGRPGPLPGTPAARANHLPLVVAMGLLCGRLLPEHLTDAAALDPRVQQFCTRTHLQSDHGFLLKTRDPHKLALPHAVQVFFADGSHTERIAIEYPPGHHRRRLENLPLLFAKAEAALATRFAEEKVEELLDLFDEPERLYALPVHRFVDLWVA